MYKNRYYKQKNNISLLELALIIFVVITVIMLGTTSYNFIISAICGCCAALVAPVGYYLNKYINKKARQRKYKNSLLSDIDRLTGKEFEEYLQVYFESKGYKAELTPDTNDYGADLLLRKNGTLTVVQAKRYKKGKIGIKAVQQVLGAREYYKADKAIVCTNRYFSASAKNLAYEADVELWDRSKLFKKKKFQNKE